MFLKKSTHSKRSRSPKYSKRIRTLSVEALEIRQLLAADLIESTQFSSGNTDSASGFVFGPASLSNATSQPSAALSEATSELPDSVQKQLDSALQFQHLVRNQSQFPQRMANEISEVSDVPSSLIRTPIAAPIDLNVGKRSATVVSEIESTSAESQRLAAATSNSISAISQFTVYRPGSALDVQQVNSPTQWIGAYCSAEEVGTLYFPQQSSSTSMMRLAAEGEGEEEEGWLSGVIPEVDFPELEFTEYVGLLDGFSPSSQSNISQITTFGSYTPSSLTNPNFLLPGLHWVRQVEQTWTSATQWSLTEKFIISFRLTNSSTTTDSESTSWYAMQSEAPEEAPPSENAQDLLLNFESETDATATRIGFYTLVFHASRGVTSPAAAGTKWSFQESYSDSIDLESESLGTIEYSPEVYDPNTHEGDELYPSDFEGVFSNTIGIGLSASSSGSTSFSSTPTINSSHQVVRNVTSSIAYDNEATVDNAESWSDVSTSGNVTFPGRSVGPITVLQEFHASVHPSSSLPVSSQDFATTYSLDLDEDPESEDEYLEELGATAGNGSLSSSGGSSSRNSASSIGGAISLSGILTDGEYSSLVGNAMNSLAAAQADSGNAGGSFYFTDEVATSTLDGPETTTISLFSTWNGNFNNDASAAGDLDVSMENVVDNIEYDFDGPNGAQEGTVNGNTKSGAKDTLEISISSVIDTTVGTNSYLSSYNLQRDLRYKFETTGTTVGDVEGIASLTEVGSEGTSELSGYSREMITSTYDKAKHITNTDIGTGVTTLAVIDDLKYTEQIISKSRIEGSLAVFRSDSGPLQVTLDVDIDTAIFVDYSYDEHQSSFSQSPDLSSFDHYQDWRTIEFSGSRNSSSSISGTASIDPHLAANDTGGFTTVDSTSYSGDAGMTVVGTSGVITTVNNLTWRDNNLEILNDR